MSASEKLKALEPTHLTVKAGADDQYPVGAITLYNVPLPQIVAVVEAAESLTFHGQEAHRYNEWHGSRIVLALAALEEALT